MSEEQRQEPGHVLIRDIVRAELKQALADPETGFADRVREVMAAEQAEAPAFTHGPLLPGDDLLRKAERERDAARQDVARLKELLRQTDGARQGQESDADASVTRLARDRDGWKERCEAAWATQTELERERDAARNKRDRWKDLAGKREGQRDEWKAAAHLAQGTVEEVRGERDTARVENDAMQRSLDAARALLRSRTDQLEAVRRERDSAHQSLRDSDGQVDAAERDRKAAVELADTLRAERDREGVSRMAWEWDCRSWLRGYYDLLTRGHPEVWSKVQEALDAEADEHHPSQTPKELADRIGALVPPSLYVARKDA